MLSRFKYILFKREDLSSGDQNDILKNMINFFLLIVSQKLYDFSTLLLLKFKNLNKASTKNLYLVLLIDVILFFF